MMNSGLRRLLSGAVALMLLGCSSALADTATVTARKLILREKASSTSDALQTLPKGTKLEVLGKSGSWYKVTYGKYTGYVYKTYVSVTKTASSSSSSSSTTRLEKGSTGSDVKELQTKLKKLGYYDAYVDGDYGDTTVAAVKAFQKKYNLTADGVAGSETLKKLDSAYKNADSDKDDDSLRKGATGSAVKDLQTKLKKLGFYNAYVDGSYGDTTVAAVKAIIAGTKALISAIAAGGWVAVVIIIVVCLIALIVGSCFGIFFSGEDSGSSMTMQSVVQEINTDYQTQLDTTKTNISYDVLEMSGSRAVWPEVLAVYAVKTTTDPNNPQDVATMDASKKAILKDIFWQMNTISSRTETKTEEIITETDDGHGNIVETKTTVTRTYLYISVAHKTAGEMADKFGFNADQRKQLAELLAEENRSMWSAVLYGIYTEDGQIVSVALSQIGNVGGQPYWSWYGFDSRVEWCACFVSWAANECGYIDSGIIPKFAGCTNGVQWFKDRGQWIDNSATPSPGMIIFFDWNNKGSSGPQDGLSDHVGIVERVEDGIIYTIEGNSGDSCRENHYAVGHYEFLGYGVPAY